MRLESHIANHKSQISIECSRTHSPIFVSGIVAAFSEELRDNGAPGENSWRFEAAPLGLFSGGAAFARPLGDRGMGSVRDVGGMVGHQKDKTIDQQVALSPLTETPEADEARGV